MLPSVRILHRIRIDMTIDNNTLARALSALDICDSAWSMLGKRHYVARNIMLGEEVLKGFSRFNGMPGWVRRRRTDKLKSPRKAM